MNSIRNNINSVIPFIPFRILKKIFSTDGHALRRIEPLRGAILFIDIAGFTSLTIALSKIKPKGIEIQQEILSNYFAKLITIIREFGGVVYQFAGDSILVSFEIIKDENAPKCAFRACSCALKIQNSFFHFEKIEAIPGKIFSLITKIGIGYGDYYEIHLGNEETRLNPIIVGKACDLGIKAEKFAPPGETIVSDEIWNFLPQDKKGEQIENFYKLKNIPESKDKPKFDYNIPESKLGKKFLEQCSGYIYHDLFKKYTTGIKGFQGDYREVACLFISFGGLDFHFDAKESAKKLNQFYEHAQNQSRKYGGILLQVDLTDKGNVFLFLFGAPTALENKEIRATQLAFHLIKVKDLFPFIDTIRAGIATGLLYCGEVGAAFRKDYTALGRFINLAARLMIFGKDSGTPPTSNIFVDERTAGKIGKRFVTERIENVELKGVDKPTTIYEIKKEKERFRGLLIDYSTDEMVGRSVELNQLREIMLKSFDKAGQICALSGDAGIGKSLLTSSFVHELEEYSAEPLVGYCYSYERNTPFFPWKDLLLLFFQIFNNDDIETKIKKIQDEFENLKGINVDWVPVLAGILGISIDETAFTQNLDARQKNQRIFEIVWELLKKKSVSMPPLIFFEDYHWADEISIKLIEYIAERIHTIPAMILLVMRPEGNIDNLKQLGNFKMIELTELDEDRSSELLYKKLQLEIPNPAFENLILEKAQGNPFFLETIVNSLIEGSYLIKGPDNKYKVKGNIHEIQLPNTLHDVILTRIDRLNENEKIILKTASVIGRLFSYETLFKLCTNDLRTGLNASLDILRSHDLTPLETKEPLTYIFKHIVIRDVAYKTILIETREALHQQLAEYLEDQSKSNLNEAADILAYHFLAGNDKDRGLEYTLMAARKAKNQYANENAIRHFKKALDILKKPEFLDRKNLFFQVKEELAEVYRQAGNYQKAIRNFNSCLKHKKTKVGRAKIHLGIGTVFQERGEFLKANPELEKALKLLGKRVPSSKVSIRISLIGQLLIQIGHAIFPRFIKTIAKHKVPLYQMQNSIIVSLGKMYYFTKIEKFVWANLVLLNLAERLRTDYDLTVSYNSYATALASSGFSKFIALSEKYYKKSLKIAQKISNPMAEALALERWGMRGFCINDPDASRKKENKAISIFKQIGEMWELQTALLLEGLAYAYLSDFESAIRLTKELRDLARGLNSQHQSWDFIFRPFYEYLVNKDSPANIEKRLKKGFSLTYEINDLMLSNLSLKHLTLIAVREGNAEKAAQLALESFKSIRQYKIILPHIQMAFVDSAEAALFALEQGVTSVPRKELLNIAKKGFKKGIKLGKGYPFILGPAIRVKARYITFTKGVKKAESIFTKAIEILVNSPNKWETGVAYYDAAVSLPHKRKEYLKKAKEIFKEYNIQAELRRIEYFENNLNSSQKLEI